MKEILILSPSTCKASRGPALVSYRQNQHLASGWGDQDMVNTYLAVSKTVSNLA